MANQGDLFDRERYAEDNRGMMHPVDLIYIMKYGLRHGHLTRTRRHR